MTRFVLNLYLAFVCMVVFLPFVGQAKDMQADQQCPAGGVVGQTCKDNTNGYTTSGHCTHINICAADNWPKAPKGCQPGQTAGQDCPYGKNPPVTTTPKTGITATTVPQVSFGQTIGEDILISAFANADGPVSPTEQSIVGSTSIEGIEFFITSDNEQLQVGEPLTALPEEIHYDLGSVYFLNPAGKGSLNISSAPVGSNSYQSRASFGMSSGLETMARDRAIGNFPIVGSIMDSIVSLWYSEKSSETASSSFSTSTNTTFNTASPHEHQITFMQFLLHVLTRVIASFGVAFETR